MTGTDLKRDYYKKYRENNKDKIKQYNKNYWNKKASEVTNENL